MQGKRGLIAALAVVLLLCASCSAKPAPAAPTASPQPAAVTATDLIGTYTDCQGTSDVYSELTLEKLSDGTYAATISLYRLTELEGVAEAGEDGILLFSCEEPAVKGEIAIQDGAAAFTVTESGFAGIDPGTVYRFPDEEGPSADA